MVRKVIITTLTVLACLTLVLEVLSYRLYLIKYLQSPTEFAWFEAHRGMLRIERMRDVPDSLDEYDWHFLGARLTDRIGSGPHPPEDYLPEDYLALARSGLARRRVTNFALPLWMPLVLFAAYPLVVFARGPLRRWRRRKRGGCQNCGYDLRGNVSGTCPECGSSSR